MTDTKQSETPETDAVLSAPQPAHPELGLSASLIVELSDVSRSLERRLRAAEGCVTGLRAYYNAEMDYRRIVDSEWTNLEFADATRARELAEERVPAILAAYDAVKGK